MGLTKPEVVAETHSVTGVVKWYDQGRGYGFVVPDEGGADVLLHASCVRNFGLNAVKEADRVVLEATRTDRGVQAVRLVSVESAAVDSVAPAAPVDAVRPSDIAASASPHGALFPARVKWFDKHKGFGFVNVYGDPSDVFVHMETVRDSGLTTLMAGEAILVRTTKGPRGAMVCQLSDWESVNLVESTEEANLARITPAEKDDR